MGLCGLLLFIMTFASASQRFGDSTAASTCGKPKFFMLGRIVGGAAADFGTFPWQISLRQRSIYKDNKFYHSCGASLLNERWAITAAHCVEKMRDPSENMQLRMGQTNYTNEHEELPYKDVEVDIAAIHPQYDTRTYDYDLALLRFRQPIEFKDNIIPICLPDPTNKNFYLDGEMAVVTGWGRTEQDNETLPSELQMVMVPIIENTKCEKMYNKANFNLTISNVTLCAGYSLGGQDACQGDSGGPMVMTDDVSYAWTLIGVVSWGIGCAKSNQPGVYVRVAEFRKWIDNIIMY